MTSKDLYNMGHIASLERDNQLGRIKSSDVLIDFKEFMRDNLIDEDIGEISPVNYPLKNTFKPSQDIVAIPEEV